MNQRPRPQDRRRISPLVSGELSSRRAGWRRQRARRRLGIGAALGLILVGVAVLGLTFRNAGSSVNPQQASLLAPGTQPGSHRQSGAHRSQGSVHGSSAAQSQSVDDTLRYTSYVQLAGTRRREMALTFDDGPSSYTGAIVRILRKTHTPATFFLIGRWASTYPQVVRAEARDGFQIGDHTENHLFMSEYSPSVQTRQIQTAADAIRRAGAPYPRLFRPPYGAFNSTTLGILRARRMLLVLWSVDSKDYTRPGAARIAYVALSGARPGAIILMHDGGGNRSETVAALPRIIRGLRRRGFRLVTISQLLADDPPARGQPVPHSLAGRG